MPAIFFVSETRENSQGNLSVLCFRKFLVAKKFMHKRGLVSGSSVDNFLSYSAEKIRRGTLLCFTDFPVSKKFMEKRGGTRICRRNFFVSESRENSQGNPSVLCFRNFLVTKKFMHKRGVVSRSSVDYFFVLQCRKIRREKHFFVSQNFRYQKNL